MSVSIPAHFVKQFSTNVHLLAEQRMSRLRPCVTIGETVVGESWTEERIGQTQDAANTVTTRHSDTPLNNTPHTRRWGFVADYDVADLIDKQDRVKLLVDVDGPYTLRHAGVMGRSIDTSIINALEGSVIEGQNGTTTTTYDTTNQEIAAGSVGLTIAKLIEAKKKLDAAEVEEFDDRFFVCSAEQIADLLEDDKVTSKDFNTVQALVRGDIDTFMGFKFVRSERLTSSSGRWCYAFARSGIVFRPQTSPTSIVSDRPDKRHAKQIYTYGSWGAVRREDKRVVRVICTE